VSAIIRSSLELRRWFIRLSLHDGGVDQAFSPIAIYGLSGQKIAPVR
jgi:hypothetical protein